MDLDYVNFHWYSQSAADAQGLGETIAYLQRATGKKVITNEIVSMIMTRLHLLLRFKCAKIIIFLS